METVNLPYEPENNDSDSLEEWVADAMIETNSSVEDTVEAFGQAQSDMDSDDRSNGQSTESPYYPTAERWDIQ